MTVKNLLRLINALLIALVIGFVGCERELDMLEPAAFPTTGDVFIDGFSGGLDYQAFSNTKLDAITIDPDEKFSGESSMRITVPSEGDPSGFFSGGALVAPGGRNLSGYDALTFWARASIGAPLGLVGFGNDNSGASLYPAARTDIVLTTTWQKYVIPIPDAAKLTAEKGMFQFSVGAFEGAGFNVWFDEIQFERLGTIAQPRAIVTSPAITGEVGETISAGVTGVIYDVNGSDVTVLAAPAYFTFGSSDESVATIDAQGNVVGVGVGTAEITVRLGAAIVANNISVNVVPAAPRPTTTAPTPTADPADVISMFSNAYNNVLIDTWDTGWEFSTADVQDILVSGDDVKKYTNLNFVGIEFASQTINASEMTHFHLDIWTPDPTAAAAFKVLLVDFGANNVFDGGDDSSHELTFTSPQLTTENWISLDIPLSNFTGLVNRANLAQLVLSGDLSTVYVDNVYFYEGEVTGGGEPAEAAPTPTVDPADVISLFSNAYTNVTVDTWSAEWDNADVADVQVFGNDTKLYTNMVFAGVEFTSQTVDATAMTHFHMDVWTPDPTALPATFKVKLVDFGADGAFDGGDDVEHELTFDASTNPALATGSWVGIDVPLSDFVGLTTRANMAQMILSSDPGSVYVDNVYFYTGDGNTPTEPTEAAPAPTEAAADVISLFSNAYTNVTVDTWSAEWDDADVADVQVVGDDTKLYTNLVFAGVEFTSQTIDVTGMTHFSMDIWTPSSTAPPASFRLKLVDFGPDGAFDGGDDTEHEITLDETTIPAISSGSWISIDIPLTDFVNLTTREHMAQMIISSELSTIYVDNVYFYNSNMATEPGEAAPTPTLPAADVISLFSNAYTNVTVDTWSAEWDNADVADVQVVGDDTKLYTSMVFAGIEFTSQTIDATAMTHFHMNVWTPDPSALPAVFKVKLVDFGADGAFDGGDDAEHELTFDANSTPALVTGQWITFDIPLADFTGLVTRGHLAQIVIVADPGPNTVYIDNVLLHQ